MRLSRFLCAALVFSGVLLIAESKNPADYPLRIHIFGRTQMTFFRNRAVDEGRGDERANLFANGEVRGVDFSYDCGRQFRPSVGFDTYPAKWKKPNEELVVLFPVFGKANAYYTCKLKTNVRNDAYFLHDGRLDTETAERFKAWMTKHEYDPEHGKNEPFRLDPSRTPAEPTQ